MARGTKTGMQEKVNNAVTSENAVKVVQKFEQIIKNKKSNIIQLTKHQGHISKI